MTAPSETVWLAECPVCGDLILAARISGLTYRLTRWSVPKAAAVVLARYGVTVLRLVPGRQSVHLTEFDPASKSPDPLVTTHVCGIDPSKF